VGAKIKKRVLIVANYPIRRPHHGGQKRVKAITNYYRSIIDEVKVIPVFHRALYDYDEKEDVLLGDDEIIKKIDENNEEIELITGMAVREDAHVKNRLNHFLVEFKPDIIHFEQPFLYAGFKKLLIDLGMKPKIVYGSQNIEYKLKKEVLENTKLNEHDRESIISRTKNAEKEICRDSDLTIAVTEDDATILKDFGAKKVIVAPNGIDSFKVSVAEDSKGNILFVGSGHPPNAVGFLEMLGSDLSYLPPQSELNIAGGVSEILKKSIRSENVVFHGAVSEEELTSLLNRSEILLLPITTGGGSNLKTAEAILADKKIVATSFAFRSFEKYLSLSNIYIADTPKDFQHAIITAIADKKIKRSAEQKELAETVQWKYCLEPLEKELKRVLRDNPVAYVRKKLGLLKRKLIR